MKRFLFAFSIVVMLACFGTGVWDVWIHRPWLAVLEAGLVMLNGLFVRINWLILRGRIK